MLPFALKRLSQFALILHSALVTTSRVYFALIVTVRCVTHDSYFRRQWNHPLGSRAPKVGVARVSGTLSPGTKTSFKFTTLNTFPVFLTPQSVCEGMITSGISPFCVPENQKLIMQT